LSSSRSGFGVLEYWSDGVLEKAKGPDPVPTVSFTGSGDSASCKDIEAPSGAAQSRVLRTGFLICPSVLVKIDSYNK
jgi:hypothetical protein